MANKDDESSALASEIQDRIAKLNLGTENLNFSACESNKNIENLEQQLQDSNKRLIQLKKYQERLNESKNILELDAKIAYLKKLLLDITDENPDPVDLDSGVSASGIEGEKSASGVKDDDEFSQICSSDDEDSNEETEEVFKKANPDMKERFLEMMIKSDSSDDDLEKQQGSSVDDIADVKKRFLGKIIESDLSEDVEEKEGSSVDTADDISTNIEGLKEDLTEMMGGATAEKE